MDEEELPDAGSEDCGDLIQARDHHPAPGSQDPSSKLKNYQFGFTKNIVKNNKGSTRRNHSLTHSEGGAGSRERDLLPLKNEDLQPRKPQTPRFTDKKIFLGDSDSYEISDDNGERKGGPSKNESHFKRQAVELKLHKSGLGSPSIV